MRAFLNHWGVSCTEYERWDSAARVVSRALAIKFESNNSIHTLEALVLAQQEKYPEALAALEKNKFIQTIRQSGDRMKFPIVGDILLLKKY